MKTFEINIAKAYTMSDWRGLPAHFHHAKVTLEETLTEADAMDMLERLAVVYPWPEFHLTLASSRVVYHGENVASTAPEGFLKAHRWSYRSVAKTAEGGL